MRYLILKLVFLLVFLFSCSMSWSQLKVGDPGVTLDFDKINANLQTYPQMERWAKTGVRGGVPFTDSFDIVRSIDPGNSNDISLKILEVSNLLSDGELGLVILNEGDYALNAQINMKSNVSLMGESREGTICTISFQNGYGFEFNNISMAGIYNLTIQGGWGKPKYDWNYGIPENDEMPNNENVSVRFRDSQDCWLDKVNIYNSGRDVIRCNGIHTTLRNLKIDGVHRKAGGGLGYLLINSSDNLITGCEVTHLRHISVQNQGGEFNVVYDNEFHQEVSFHTDDNGNNLIEANRIILPEDMPPVFSGGPFPETNTNLPNYFAIMGPWSTQHVVSSNPNFLFGNKCLQLNHDYGTKIPWSDPSKVYSGPIKIGRNTDDHINNFPVFSSPPPSGNTLYAVTGIHPPSVDSNIEGEIEITELRTQGSNNADYDIIELRAAPGYTIPKATYLSSIGNGADGGLVLTKLDISDIVFPSDGILTIGKTSQYSPDHIESGLNLNSFVNLSVIITQGDAPGSDIDSDDDGIIDLRYWTDIIDGLAIVESPASPSVPDYSGVLEITSVANEVSPQNIYRHIIKDPITGKWRGNRDNEGSSSETFGVPNHSEITASEVLSEDVEISNLNLNLSSSLTVKSGVTLEVLGDVINNGNFSFESGSSLVEIGASFMGNAITFNRTTQHTNDALRHSLVGSPVSGFSLNNLGGQQYYQYNEAEDTWVQETSNPTMIAGQGYSVVGKTDLQFSGVPNSGTISVSATEGAFKLLANPYPCAIDIEEFFNENTGALMSETIRIWNDGGSESGQRQTSDYLTINSLGIAQSGNTGAKSKDSFIDNRVGAMQGFFVETSVSGSSIVFTDAMKVSDDNDDEGFFRSNDSDLQKVTIKLSNGSSFSEVLLGFIDGATDSFDPKYDALKLSDSGALQLDALVGDQPYTILSSPSLIGNDVILPFQFSAEAGSYTISAGEYDLLPKDYFVYVFDKQLNSFHSLLEAAYEFTTSSVQTSDRFEIVLTRSSSPFTVTGTTILEPEVLLFSTVGGVGVKTTFNYKSAEIFDLTGKVIESNLQLMEEAYGYRLDVSLTLDKIYIIRLDDTSVKFLYQ